MGPSPAGISSVHPMRGLGQENAGRRLLLPAARESVWLRRLPVIICTDGTFSGTQNQETTLIAVQNNYTLGRQHETQKYTRMVPEAAHNAPAPPSAQFQRRNHLEMTRSAPSDLSAAHRKANGKASAMPMSGGSLQEELGLELRLGPRLTPTPLRSSGEMGYRWTE